MYLHEGPATHGRASHQWGQGTAPKSPPGHPLPPPQDCPPTPWAPAATPSPPLPVHPVLAPSIPAAGHTGSSHSHQFVPVFGPSPFLQKPRLYQGQALLLSTVVSTCRKGQSLMLHSPVGSRGGNRRWDEVPLSQTQQKKHKKITVWVIQVLWGAQVGPGGSWPQLNGRGASPHRHGVASG